MLVVCCRTVQIWTKKYAFLQAILLKSASMFRLGLYCQFSQNMWYLNFYKKLQFLKNMTLLPRKHGFGFCWVWRYDATWCNYPICNKLIIEVFRVRDYKFGIRKLKFKIFDRIWRQNCIENHTTCIKLMLNFWYNIWHL